MRLAARLTGWKIDIRSASGPAESATPAVEKPVQPTDVEDITGQPASAEGFGEAREDAFEETKSEMGGDESGASDTGEANLEPVAQDRDIPDEKVEEEQEEPVEKEKDAE